MSKFHATDFDFLPEHAFRLRPGGGMTLEGGKGGSTPPPDPRLVEAQIKSLGTQDSMIQRMVAQADEMLPLQKEQLRFGLDTARDSYNQSQEDRTYALGKRAQLDQVQKPLIDEASNYNEGVRRAQMMQEANADIASAFDVSRSQQMRALERRGAAPNAGRSLVLRNQMDTGEALARASAGRKVSEAAKAEGINLRTNASNMLAGYPAMASGLSGSGFGFGTAGLGLANQGLAGMNSGYGQAAGVAGQAGQNATGMYGAQANAYGQAQNAKASGQGAMMGGIATIGAAAITVF